MDDYGTVSPASLQGFMSALASTIHQLDFFPGGFAGRENFLRVFDLNVDLLANGDQALDASEHEEMRRLVAYLKAAYAQIRDTDPPPPS